MRKLNSTVSTFLLAAACATGVMSTLDWTSAPNVFGDRPSVGILQAYAQDASEVKPSPKRVWAASATGRIEPISGVIRLSPEVSGRVVRVNVESGSTVEAGDVLVQLDDEDARNRIKAGTAEISVAKQERDDTAEEETPPSDQVLERRKAQDDLSDALRAVFSAQRAVDEAVDAKRQGKGEQGAVERTREALVAANANVAEARKALAIIEAKPDAPETGRLEGSLEINRAELSSFETAFERTRIRAPINGTVLRTDVRIGELIAPSRPNPIIEFGDISKLRVRAEVEERDAGKVRVGQKVVVKSDAFPEQEFTGTVTLVSSALGRPRITTRGPRRPNDVDVLEVLAEIDGTPPLLTGMRVDVFFKIENGNQTRTSSAANNNQNEK